MPAVRKLGSNLQRPSTEQKAKKQHQDEDYSENKHLAECCETTEVRDHDMPFQRKEPVYVSYTSGIRPSQLLPLGTAPGRVNLTEVARTGIHVLTFKSALRRAAMTILEQLLFLIIMIPGSIILLILQALGLTGV